MKSVLPESIEMLFQNEKYYKRFFIKFYVQENTIFHSKENQ